ncbi:MAG: IclR family transcriptional regulator [Methylobacteriaceae bacterium]|jgi:DNA-binding IclR family transcriptional regulator|nr:IclR family transcriptional regulator [Methylobacteriaceae bacterium]
MEAKVKSLDKALRVLNCFTPEEPELGISELSRRLDLYKSNVHSIVTTMEKNGFIEKNETTGRYRLGLGVMRLAHVVTSGQGGQRIIHRFVRELSEEVDEIVYFGVRWHHAVMYLEGAYPDRVYNLRWGAGMVAPLTCTGIGKAILAFSEDRVIDDVLSRPIDRFTDATITDPGKLRDELQTIRTRGYSTDNMEHEYGVKCVGVPVFNRNNELVGAFSSTGPSLRFSDNRIPALAKMLKEKALALRNSL